MLDSASSSLSVRSRLRCAGFGHGPTVDPTRIEGQRVGQSSAAVVRTCHRLLVIVANDPVSDRVCTSLPASVSRYRSETAEGFSSWIGSGVPPRLLSLCPREGIGACRPCVDRCSWRVFEGAERHWGG